MNTALSGVEIDKTLPISRQVYDVLRRRIVDNTLPPGARLSEATLAQEFAISRTPLRAALQQLASEGLVTIRPQVGTVVAQLDHERLRQAVFVRTALECAVVERLATLHPDLSPLDPILARQAEAARIDDYATFFHHDEAFHAKLAALAGVPDSWPLVQSVKGHVDRQRYTLMSQIPMRSRRAFDEHLSIIARIRDGDAKGASQTMAAHVGSVLELDDGPTGAGGG
ncbi:MAG: GntR family transcriptional regulator [Marinibacterium sp.]|nr:GntR family transcriptional regulator [Marinibacterium sp.]